MEIDFEIGGVKYVPIPIFKFRDGPKFFLFLKKINANKFGLEPYYIHLIDTIKIGAVRFIDIHGKKKVTRIKLSPRGVKVSVFR
jgi:hypothetical protein